MVSIEVSLSALAQLTLPAAEDNLTKHTGKSPLGIVFLFLLQIFFCFSFSLVLLVLCYFEFCETQRNNIYKM